MGFRFCAEVVSQWGQGLTFDKIEPVKCQALTPLILLKERLKKRRSEVVTRCDQLKMEASDGKRYLTDAANPETLLRLIQSVPSPKAEQNKLKPKLFEVFSQKA